MIDAYTDHDDYMDDEDDYEDAEEWQEGQCDNCYGDTGEIATNRPGGWTVCACAAGQGASPEDCRCGPPADGEE